MTDERVYIGCDPGESGGIAIMGRGHDRFIRWDRHTTKDAFDILYSVGRLGVALVEMVRSRPGQGAPSTFKFGQSYGKLITLLVCAGISFDEVTPAKWQREMQCRTGGDKNVTRKRAQELFPNLKITHRNADAYLLAELCRRRRTRYGQ